MRRRAGAFTPSLPTPSALGGSGALLVSQRGNLQAKHVPHPAPGPPPVRPTPSTKDPWESLQGLVVSLKWRHPKDVTEDKPLARGGLVEKVSANEYKIRLREPFALHRDHRPHPDRLLDVGSRARLFLGGSEDLAIGGLVVRVNGNGTYTMLMDSGEVELSVATSDVGDHEPPTKALHNAKFLRLLDWLGSCVYKPADREAVGLILHQQGWRVERLFLLERSDVTPLQFITVQEREAILEKATWEKEHHNVARFLRGERVKDHDFRYALAKYKGTISCISGIFVVTYVFTANLRAYRKQQRSYLLKVASQKLLASCAPEGPDGAEARRGHRGGGGGPVEALAKRLTHSSPEEGDVEAAAARLAGEEARQISTSDNHTDIVYMREPSDNSRSSSRGSGWGRRRRRQRGAAAAEGSSTATNIIDRREEERLVQQVIRQLDLAHSRIIVFTGFEGSGKTTVVRTAVRREDVPSVFVDVRGQEDTLRCIVHSLGVHNIDVCGDLLDFVADVFHSVAARHPRHAVPVLSVKVHHGASLERVHKEAMALMNDRRACHVCLEVPLEALTPQNVALSRLDFYTIPNFSREQAMRYTEHLLDAVDLSYFIDTAGTNCGDLDELHAAVFQRDEDPITYTSMKLMKAMRLVEGGLRGASSGTRTALRELAAFSFESGLPGSHVEDPAGLERMGHLLLHDPVQDRWVFRQKVFHTAARCCMI